MGKQKTRKGVQRFAFLCSIFIMAFLFTLIFTKETDAKGKKSNNQCSLQSVTIEVDGKEYVCDGSLEYIPVCQDADWKEFLKTVKITDYKVLVNDCCSHVEGHDSITAMLVYKEPIAEFCIYEENGTGGKSTYPDVEENLTSPMYYADFCLDGDINSRIRIGLAKECPISYELNGGSFLKGMDVPDTCGAGKSVELISPVKSDSQFLGWTLEGTEGYQTSFTWNGVDSPPTCVANWDDSAAPIDIGTVGIKLKSSYGLMGGGATPKPDIYTESQYDEISLTEGIDYILSYENNDKIAASDSDNPPTVVITGIGKYTGTVRKEFTITKDNVRFIYNYSSGFACLNIVKGKPLSSIDLSKFYAYSETYDSYVEGTFSWENEDYIPDADVGAYFNPDPDETHCNLIFTPDNLECCDKTTVSMAIAIHVYQGSIADCQITFESGQQSYLYNGEAIKPAVIVKDGDTTLTEGEDYEVSYAGYINVASSTDKYAPTVTIKGRGNYLGTQEVTYTISMSPEAPVLTAVNETIKGKNDGSITGLTTDMEYRMALPSVGENTTSFTPVTDAAMTFPAGTYEVRYAAKGIYDPSPVTTVSIQQGKTLTVNLPTEQTGYTLTATTNQLSWLGTTTLTLTLAPGYTKTNDFALEANVNIVDNKDGTYTISGVTEDVTVTVKGITKDTTPSVGTMLKDKGNKAYYIGTKVNNGTVEVQYKTPVKKTKTVTIPKNVTLSDGTVAKVTSIANNAFKNNKNLQEITIGNNVTTIGKNAFSGCTKLQKVVIGTGVTTIGGNAFKNCKNLKTITIKSKKLNTLSKTSLKGIPSKATIKVPSSKYITYKKLFKKKGLKKSVKIKK